jgi:hypothetical protein
MLDIMIRNFGKFFGAEDLLYFYVVSVDHETV